MTKFMRLFLVWMGLLPVVAMAQLNTFTTTTFSSAVATLPNGSTPPQTIVYVASATGIQSPNINNGGSSTQGSLLYADREALRVLSISGTAITVQRGANGTNATGHLTGALVWIGNPDWYAQDPPYFAPSGTCTLKTTYALPRIELLSGEIFTCDSSGTWAYAGPFMTEGSAANARTTVNDAAYTAQAWDSYIGYTAITAGRAVTLPAASSMVGKVYFLVNEAQGAYAITAGTYCATTSTLFSVRCRSNGTNWISF